MKTGLATVPATAETLQLLQPQQQEWPLKALKQNQQVPVSVTPVQKQKKCTWKSPCKNRVQKQSRRTGRVKRMKKQQHHKGELQSHHQGHHKNWKKRQNNHSLIPFPEWAMGDTRRFQSLSRWVYYHLAAPVLGQQSQQCGIRDWGSQRVGIAC